MAKTKTTGPDVQAVETTGAVTPVTPKSFEVLLRDLEEIVARLERGEQSLEAALGEFERGVALARDARQVLEAAEIKLARLVAGGDGTEEAWDGGEGR